MQTGASYARSHGRMERDHDKCSRWSNIFGANRRLANPKISMLQENNPDAACIVCVLLICTPIGTYLVCCLVQGWLALCCAVLCRAVLCSRYCYRYSTTREKKKKKRTKERQESTEIKEIQEGFRTNNTTVGNYRLRTAERWENTPAVSSEVGAI